MLGQHHVELFDHLRFTGHQAIAFDEMTVQGRVILPGRQAAVAPPCFLGQLRVDAVQIVQHLMDRVAHAVNVEATELHAVFTGALMVVAVQPVGKGFDLGVAPHPGGEAAEDMAFPGRRGQPSDVFVDMPCIGPVGLNGDDGEAMPLNQALRDGGPGAIEIAGAVAGFADQHHPRIRVAIEHFAERCRIERRQRLGKLAQDRGDGGSIDLPRRAIVFILHALGGCAHGRRPVQCLSIPTP